MGMTFFYKNAINVFADASVDTSCDSFVTAPGFLTVCDGKIINSGVKVIHGGTNNYGEIDAILMGVYELIKHKDSDYFLNVYSDSQISIMGLTEWIYCWFRNKARNEFRNSEGEPVANQEIFLEIMRLIIHSGVHISFFHIKGHCQSNNVNDMQRFRKNFIMNKKGKGMNELLNVPNEILQEMADFNSIVDNMTREVLKSTIAQPSYNPGNYMKLKKWPLQWFPDREGMMYFKYLTS